MAFDRVSKVLLKIFGSRNERLIKSYTGMVERANAFEDAIRQLDDAALKAKTAEFKAALAAGADPDDILAEAFAVVRETARRTVEMRHFDVQLIGGNVLFEGKIAEMATGEGKTLVATLAAYMVHLTGRRVHLVTVNDYLAKRDAEWMAPVYNALGMTVGAIQADMDTAGQERKDTYLCDVTYGTNSEFGFDYLRDNMKTSLEQMVQGSLEYAIIDEVDSILIDEARTPLIISGPAHNPEDIERYKKADQVAKRLIAEQQKHQPLQKQINYDKIKRRAILRASDIKSSALGTELTIAEKDRDALKRNLELVRQELKEAKESGRAKDAEKLQRSIDEIGNNVMRLE